MGFDDLSNSARLTVAAGKGVATSVEGRVRESSIWGGPAGCETRAYVRRKGLWPTCGVPVCVVMWGLRWWPQAYRWLPVRDESGGFSFGFASFAKFSQSFEAAVGEVVGLVRRANHGILWREREDA